MIRILPIRVKEQPMAVPKLLEPNIYLVVEPDRIVTCDLETAVNLFPSLWLETILNILSTRWSFYLL